MIIENRIVELKNRLIQHKFKKIPIEKTLKEIYEYKEKNLEYLIFFNKRLQNFILGQKLECYKDASKCRKDIYKCKMENLICNKIRKKIKK